MENSEICHVVPMNQLPNTCVSLFQVFIVHYLSGLKVYTILGSYRKY